MPDWLFEPRRQITAPPVGAVLADFPDPIDLFTDTVDSWNKALNKTFNDFSSRVIELGGGSSLPAPQARAVKVVAVVLKGLKIIKLLVGEDEKGGFDVALDAFDYGAIPDNQLPDVFRTLFEQKVRQLQTQASGMGYVVMDPVWMADPRAGGV